MTWTGSNEQMEALASGMNEEIKRQTIVLNAYVARIAELEAAVLAAKALLEPTNEATEDVWQLLDDAYHRRSE